MDALGKHLLSEYFDCNSEILNNVELIENICRDAAEVSGATIVSSNFHRFSPWGVSGVVVISESHITIHTWPEYGFAAVDLFTCGEKCNPWKAHDYIFHALQAKDAKVEEYKRGELDIPNLQHKPTNSFVVTAKGLE
ncbi:adenosylmethionine decarboxylase [bacterium]|nr:adenosylmethionine decarboxylase [bacterium]